MVSRLDWLSIGLWGHVDERRATARLLASGGPDRDLSRK